MRILGHTNWKPELQHELCLTKMFLLFKMFTGCAAKMPLSCEVERSKQYDEQS